MLERCLKRAETSGRADDNPDTIKKRVQNYFDQSYPVIEYYNKFGKVRKIDARGDISQVYAQTKAAVLPQTMFIVGPKAAGKTCIAENLAARTNMKHININQFVEEKGLKQADDEQLCMALIQHLSKVQEPRVILESFPQNLFQAKFFLRNCKQPSNVFSLDCSKEQCQERMIERGEKAADYVPSTILSQKIKQYHEQAKELLPFLEKQTNFHRVSTEKSFEKTMEDVNSKLEPCVIHIRPGANSNDLRKQMTEQLSSQHGFINLDINALIRDENERKTSIGQEMNQMVQSNRIIPAEMIVRMLKKIIYSGQPHLNKFILTSFPDIIEQAKEFEQNCSKIQAIIYSTTQDSIVEIKNNNISLFNIDSLFQKEFRLQTMSEWDYSIFNEKLGNRVEFGVVLGRPYTGKSTIADYMAANFGMKVIDMKAIAEKIRPTLGTEDEPFEGDVPMPEVEKFIRNFVEEQRRSSERVKFVFDGYTHKSVADFHKFFSEFGVPEFLLELSAEEKAIRDRFCKKNEVDDVGEEQAEELKQQKEADEAATAELMEKMKPMNGRFEAIQLSTSSSLETTLKSLKDKFSPQVILVNHEKRLGIDTTCANLAIKYNMIYISSYQIIKAHIEGKTPWGKRLEESRREKSIILSSQVKDEFNEVEFSPVHFDQTLVMELLKETIASKRQNQKYVLLEGMCNSVKLQEDDDRLELRSMDELFDIEKHIGEVIAIISLQSAYEAHFVDEKELVYEEFPEDALAEQPKPAAEEGDEAAEGEEGEKKAPAFNPALYNWTITNREPKNLPQLFLSLKGKMTTQHETKTSDQFSSSQYEAISRSLDEFCKKVSEENQYCYQQINFGE